MGKSSSLIVREVLSQVPSYMKNDQGELCLIKEEHLKKIRSDLDEQVKQAAQPLPPFRRSMQIFVKPITGKTITVMVDTRDTILDLKKMLHARLSVPTRYQRL